MNISKVTREHRENLAKTVKEKCEQALKKMREIENKTLRKVKESKGGNEDLRYNVSQHVILSKLFFGILFSIICCNFYFFIAYIQI